MLADDQWSRDAEREGGRERDRITESGVKDEGVWADPILDPLVMLTKKKNVLEAITIRTDER
jgi:hypothetical protein